MSCGSEIKSRVLKEIESLTDEALATSRYIHSHPELGGVEFLSSARLMDDLKRHGFAVEAGTGGMETAFKATVEGRGDGPRLAFLAEYDALGLLGHACGHNFIGTASTFAGIALASVMKELPGTLMVFGTPAEENLGGKIIMHENGAFKGVDAAMMVHPSNETRIQARTLAVQVLEFEFRGKPAHAAASPWAGVNALDALIQMFVSVDQMRKQMKPTVRIPGIITYGGERTNVVPERAVGQFSCRGADLEEANYVIMRVKRCAEAAALATGCTYTCAEIGRMYYDIRPSRTLVELFTKNWLEIGGVIDENPDKGQGSLDIGNLSYDFPCVHPSICIAPQNVATHTKEFADCARAPRADEQLLQSIRALALTALDIYLHPDLFRKMKEENSARL